MASRSLDHLAVLPFVWQGASVPLASALEGEGGVVQEVGDWASRERKENAHGKSSTFTRAEEYVSSLGKSPWDCIGKES